MKRRPRAWLSVSAVANEALDPNPIPKITDPDEIAALDAFLAEGLELHELSCISITN